MSSRIPLLSTMVMLLVAGTQLGAQSLQTGSVIGTTVDSAGKPVPGVKIIARSGQTERTIVTNGNGEFRLSLLNVGEWSLFVSHQNYQTVSSKVRIAINDTQTLKFSLKPIASAVVEVISTPSDLDTTQAQVSTTFASEKIEKIPTNLSSLNPLDGLMATVPGVQVARANSYNIMGATDFENVMTVDGNITNLTYSNASGGALQPPREFLESVEVVTGGFGAEYGVFGGVVNALSKSGSNLWAGSAFYATNFPHSQALGFYNTKTIPPQNKPVDPDKYHRYGLTISGPIIKDKVYFFLGYQGYKDEITPTTLVAGGANYDGLKSDNAKANGPHQFSAKVNWFINTDNQLILSASHSAQDANTGNQYFDYGTLNRGTLSKSSSQSVNLTWNWSPVSNFFLITSVGKFQNPSKSGPITGVTSTYEVADYNYFVAGPGMNANVPAGMRPFLSYMTGNGNAPFNYSNNPNNQIKLDATWFLGNHQFKAGVLRQDTTYETRTSEMDIYFITNSIIGGTIFGDPGELDRIHQGQNYAKYRGVLQGYYAKDVWEFRPGIRLDVGFRYDPIRYKGQFGPYDGQSLASFEHFRTQIQPRIGLTWDVDRDGRKKVFAHFGRYFMQMPMSAVNWAKTSSQSYDAWFTGAWTYNATYSGNQLPFTLASATPSFSLPTSIQGKPNPVATDLRLPHKNMWTAGMDWTFGNGWTAGAVWTYWDLKDVMDDSWFLASDGKAAFSSVTSKVIWNPRPGPVTFKDSNGVLHTWNSDFPDPKDRYINMNIHARRNWEAYYLSLDYTWVHHYGNYQGEGANWLNYSTSYNSFGYGYGGKTTDFDYSRAIASGNYEANPVHEFKARGGIRIPAWGQEFQLGSVLTWSSGLGQTELMPVGSLYKVSSSTPFGGNGTDIAVVNNQRGNFGTSPSVLLIDLNASAEIKIRKFAIQPSVSILNIFNSRPILGYYTTRYNGTTQATLSSDPNYGQAYSGQPGRSISAGVSVRF